MLADSILGHPERRGSVVASGCPSLHRARHAWRGQRALEQQPYPVCRVTDDSHVIADLWQLKQRDPSVEQFGMQFIEAAREMGVKASLRDAGSGG
jgi:hypothetical protein